jgi:cell division protein FtsW (lipid II flippase)
VPADTDSDGAAAVHSRDEDAHHGQDHATPVALADRASPPVRAFDVDARGRAHQRDADPAARDAVAASDLPGAGAMTSSLNPLLRIPKRRATELVLLVFAVLIVVAAEAAVEAARDGHFSTRLITYAAVPIVVGVVTHLVIRRVAPYADPLLLPIVVLLNGLGLVMIHRLDLGSKIYDEQNGIPFPGAQAPTQVVWTALGVALFIAVIVIVRDHRTLQRYAYTLALVGVFFLALPAVLPARFSEVNGAHIWIRVAGFSIQPGEFAKILLTIFGAAYLVQKRDVLALAGKRIMGIDFPRGRDFGPLLVVWLVCIGVLVRGHDLGTSLLFFGLFIVLMYVATERVSWVIVGILLFAVGAYVAYQLFGTVQTRVTVWLHPFAPLTKAQIAQGLDPYYQLKQSLFGLGTGGIFGAGLGSGHPELVPAASTDYIIASFGEEIGLFGVIGLLVLYAVFVARGLAAGLGVRDSFGKMLAMGLSFLFALQLFVVVAGVTRLLPETGLTTPFLSYGGSTLLGSWALLALLVRVSDAARRPATTPPSRSPVEKAVAA